MAKKIVKVELYSQSGEQSYTGRCVGLLTDKEFNAVIRKQEVQKKLMTVRTISLADIAKVKSVQDLRLAVITNKGLNDGKGLFISEPLELVSQFTSPDDLTFIGTEGSYITVKEMEGT